MSSSFSARFPSLALPRKKDAATLLRAESAPRSIEEVSDETLITRISENDDEALALLFRRHARVIRGVAYRVLRDPSEADDLLQEIFLLIPRFSARFDSSKGSARFWVLQMTHRRALCRRRYLENRHFYKRLDLEDVAEQVADPRCETGRLEESIDGLFGNGRSEEVFAQLSSDQRETLRLYFVEGYTLVEIAERLGQSIGNIRHHYFRGLDKLRALLLGSKLRDKKAI